jgi:hypothetical protein
MKANSHAAYAGSVVLSTSLTLSVVEVNATKEQTGEYVMGVFCYPLYDICDHY